jgi:hypothetical protein
MAGEGAGSDLSEVLKGSDFIHQFRKHTVRAFETSRRWRATTPWAARRVRDDNPMKE